MKLNRNKVVAAVLAALMLVSGLSACGTNSSGNGMSRVKLYSSVSEMQGDSDAVIIGKVQSDGDTVKDVDASTSFTLAKVQVLSVVSGSVGDKTEVTVRQTGTKDTASGSLLAKDDTVMLFLVKSGLPGDKAEQYYITGSTAGVYRASGDASTASAQASDATFQRVDGDSGDSLPGEIRLSDLKR